jgi:hypothetical protein
MAKHLRRASLRGLATRPVFAVGDSVYRWEDVLLAAMVWGDWSALENEVRHGIACVKRCREMGQRLSRREVESAAREFRYTHNLESAAATEAWLRRWRLSAEDWMRYIRRSLLRPRCPESPAELAARYPATQAELSRAAKATGICGGHFDRFARKLAGRAAAYAGAGNSDVDALAAGEVRVPGTERTALLGLSEEVCREKVRALDRLEASFRRLRDQVVTPGVVKRFLSSRHTDWVRVGCICLALPTELGAREAALCVQEDGESLNDVATRCRIPAQATSFFLEDVEPRYAPLFLSARPGQLVGPLELQGEYRLFLVKEKALPSEGDAQIRDKVESALMDRAVEHEISQRVRWQR